MVVKMATASIREFLEGSTIHGLVHISTAKSKAARAVWVAIVVACFAVAIRMISSSYKEWQESPVSTTITTHPITELEFPEVTVCPPKGSNTVLNHLLEKVKDVNFTDEKKKELLDISKEVFIEIPNKKYAREVSALLSNENIRSAIDRQASLPTIDDENKITIRSSELQGSYKTPGFGDENYQRADSFDRPHYLHYILELPENIGQFVADGILVISVQGKGKWNARLQKDRLKLYKNLELDMSDAEEFCAIHGGH